MKTVGEEDSDKFVRLALMTPSLTGFTLKSAASTYCVSLVCTSQHDSADCQLSAVTINVPKCCSYKLSSPVWTFTMYPYPHALSIPPQHSICTKSNKLNFIKLPQFMSLNLKQNYPLNEIY